MHYQYEPLADEYLFQDFLKDLFNSIYKTNTFEVYRSKGYSQFGVDVYSPQLKIAIQAKKKNILRNEPELIQELLKNLNETIQSLKGFSHPVEQLYFATTTKKYATIQDEAIKNSNSGLSVQFWSWEDIQKHISDYSTLRKIYYPHLTSQPFPKELILTPHIDAGDIVGREADLTTLKDLFQSQKIVSIHGIGGLGKSSLAKLYYQNRLADFDFLLWFDYTGDLKHNLSYNESLTDNLKLTNTRGDSVEDVFQRVLNAIISLKGKTLIVIDNLQHETAISVEQEIRKLLANPEINILVASREIFPSFQTYSLTSLELKDARQVFLHHCVKNIDLTRLDELLLLIDCNPLVTELLAKTLNTAVGLTVDELILHISEGTLDNNELNLNIDPISGNLFRRITALVNIEDFQNDPYHLYILLTLSLVPAVYVPIEDLFTFFLYNERNRAPVINAITDLHNKGLINRAGDSVKMHQLIQDAIRTQCPIFAVYLGILNSIIRSLDKANNSYSANGYRLQKFAESFLSKLRGEKAQSIVQPLLMLKNNLYILYRYLGERAKSKKIAEELMTDLGSADPIHLIDPIFVSTVHHNFATYFMDEKNFEQAEKQFRKAIEINGETFNLKTIQCYNGLFVLYWGQKKLKEALECSTEALKLLQNPKAEGNDHLFAMIANNLAALHLEFGQTTKAAEFITMALKLHRESTNADKSDAALARYYASAADIFSRLDNHEVAIQFALHAIEYRSKLNLERDFELLFFYEKTAQVYEKSGDNGNAAQLREIVKAARESFIADGKKGQDFDITY